MQFLNDHEIFYNHSLNLILSLQLQLQHHQMHMLMLTMLINENLHLVPVVIIMKIIIINCVLVVVVVLIYIYVLKIYISRMCVCVYISCVMSQEASARLAKPCTFHFTKTQFIIVYLQNYISYNYQHQFYHHVLQLTMFQPISFFHK